MLTVLIRGYGRRCAPLCSVPEGIVDLRVNEILCLILIIHPDQEGGGIPIGRDIRIGQDLRPLHCERRHRLGEVHPLGIMPGAECPVSNNLLVIAEEIGVDIDVNLPGDLKIDSKIVGRSVRRCISYEGRHRNCRRASHRRPDKTEYDLHFACKPGCEAGAGRKVGVIDKIEIPILIAYRGHHLKGTEHSQGKFQSSLNSRHDGIADRDTHQGKGHLRDSEIR